MSKKVFAHWFMFPGLSRYLGRDRLSGDGSRACIVMGAPPGKEPGVRHITTNMSGVFWRRTFLRRRESQDNGTRERVSDSRTVFILMKSW